MTGERREEDGKTHRPIVPAGRQPKSRPLICRSNIREALGWLVGWQEAKKCLAWGGRRTKVECARDTKKMGWGMDRVSGWVDGGERGANDTSLGNFNFAGITVGANKNKEISAFFLLSSFASPSLSSFSPFSLPLWPVERDTSSATSDIIRPCRRPVYKTASMFDFLCSGFTSLLPSSFLFFCLFKLFLKILWYYTF